MGRQQGGPTEELLDLDQRARPEHSAEQRATPIRGQKVTPDCCPRSRGPCTPGS